MLEKYLKNRDIGGFLCAGAALVALVTSIVFFATQASASPLGHDGVLAGVFLLIGALAMIALYVFPMRFTALVGTLVFTAAFAAVFIQINTVFADVINNVTYAGGNFGMCMFYLIGSLIACLLCVTACFFKQTKDGSEMY